MRRFPKLLALLPALWLAACASLIGPRQVDLPLSRLQQDLERRFPYDERFLGLFDVHAGNPRLVLRPESGRVAVALDVAVAPILGGRGWQGGLTLSGVPRIDVQRSQLVLADPRVDELRGDGMGSGPGGQGGQLARIATSLAALFVGEVPVHSFRPADFRYAGVSFTPVKIDTLADRLVVTFEPVK
jgi:hypothetical protein